MPSTQYTQASFQACIHTCELQSAVHCDSQDLPPTDTGQDLLFEQILSCAKPVVAKTIQTASCYVMLAMEAYILDVLVYNLFLRAFGLAQLA